MGLQRQQSSMFQIIRFKVVLIIVLTILIGYVNLEGAMQASAMRVLRCVQHDRYGNEVSRSAEYLQFQDVEANVNETYIVDMILGTAVCNRVVRDLNREAIYVQQGDRYQFLQARDFSLESPCWEALADNGITGQTENEYIRSTYDVSIVAESAVFAINYPIEFLLAPAYIGRFPLLSDAPLMPFSGKGFSMEMSADALLEAQNIDIRSTNGRISQEILQHITDFYLQVLPNWSLTEGRDTDIGENPMLFPGGFVGYLALSNPENDARLDLEFTVVDRSVLRMTVSAVLPPSEVPVPPVPEALTGSSNALAAKSSLFIGWQGAEQGAPATYLNGEIESYVLSRGHYRWFMDLAISQDTFELIYSRRVHETELCDPTTFMPSVVSQP